MKNKLKKSFSIKFVKEEMKKQIMFRNVIRSVLCGCLVWRLVQAQITSKGGVQKRRSEGSESYGDDCDVLLCARGREVDLGGVFRCV